MIKLLIVDEQPIFREGLIYRISFEAEINVSGEAANSREALTLLTLNAYDVVVIDISMPNIDCIHLLEAIKDRNLQCKVVMLSMYNKRDCILAAIRYGVAGFMLKNVTSDELVDAIKIVAKGKTYFSGEIIEVMSEQLSAGTLADITHRERLVLHLVSQGLNEKCIAIELGISARTVETHKRNIKRKLGIDSTIGLVRYAMECGLAG
ncbi:DNA-binding response regulator [Thalassotalea euphylliae]|uniref:DNA-binding response regulator n=1 Tax=Thalassotalea euphylliae TaxID=1655234 RepID=A0A3E0TQY3_9GAMM|nr:response regulator transcription factor [Thalassotalea euphylliae]REL26959.1 DNA-binding response regulator [Thalassotalea euphylliae]